MHRERRRAKILLLCVVLAGIALAAVTALVQVEIARTRRAGGSAEAVAELRVWVWTVAGAAMAAMAIIGAVGYWMIRRPVRTDTAWSAAKDCPGVLGAALLGGAGESQDLTDQEHKRLRDQMFQQEKMVLIGQIAASVAHELNTPLGTILLRSQLVLRQLPDSEPQADLKMIESEAQRCRKIIDSLLSFSRRSEGAMTETDLAALIEESLSIVGKDLELKGITVESRCDDGPATVCVDVNQIQQVLLNIVTNAADAMSEGGRLSITTRPLGERNMLEIRITDTGSGMSNEVLRQATTPFFTTKGRGKGTGLGLAICQRIVEEHQGEMEIRSRLGEGTTVSIRLPRVAMKASSKNE